MEDTRVAPDQVAPGQAPQESQQLLAELQTLRQRELEWVFQEDLNRIAKAFPGKAPKSIPELGDDFLKMRSLGIDPVVAFAAIRSAESAQRPKPPPEIGPAQGEGNEQEYYSPDEVRRMNPQQVAQQLKKIERSQAQW